MPRVQRAGRYYHQADSGLTLVYMHMHVRGQAGFVGSRACRRKPSLSHVPGCIGTGQGSDFFSVERTDVSVAVLHTSNAGCVVARHWWELLAACKGFRLVRYRSGMGVEVLPARTYTRSTWTSVTCCLLREAGWAPTRAPDV